MIRWQTGKEIHNKFSELLKKINNGKLNWAFVEEEGARCFVSESDLRAVIGHLKMGIIAGKTKLLSKEERDIENLKTLLLVNLERELWGSEKGDGVK
jgi:hypothetical protein